jgi:hypothetical protein
MPLIELGMDVSAKIQYLSNPELLQLLMVT